MCEWVAPIGINKAGFDWSEKAAGILNIYASAGLHAGLNKGAQFSLNGKVAVETESRNQMKSHSFQE